MCFHLSNSETSLNELQTLFLNELNGFVFVAVSVTLFQSQAEAPQVTPCPPSQQGIRRLLKATSERRRRLPSVCLNANTAVCLLTAVN